jgi:addiction module HigA family antidote
LAAYLCAVQHSRTDASKENQEDPTKKAEALYSVSALDAAGALGVTRTKLSELVNEKRGISPEMAVRLSKVFGGSAESWLIQQARRRGVLSSGGRSATTVR